MASPFKIPKKKPAAPDSAALHMQSPLSKLQSHEDQFSRGSADRMHAGNACGSSTTRQSAPSQPPFRDVVKTLLGLNSPNRAASTANHRAAGSWKHKQQPGPRAQSSSACFTSGRRPKRASDRLLHPDLTSLPLSPQKKKIILPPGPSTKSISVDSLAELRGEGHAGSLSSSSRRDAAEKESDGGNSPESSEQQRNSDTSVGDVVSPSRTRNKPSAGKSLPTAARGSCVPMATSLSARAMANRRRSLDRTAEQRERSREFRERKTSNRSAVLQLRLREPKQTEPIVLSSEEEEEVEDEGDGAKRASPCSSWADQSLLAMPKQIQGRQASSPNSGRAEDEELPSYLELDFDSLHAGLSHVDAARQMMITENGITIPLKGVEEGEVTVVASQVRGYGIWDGGVVQGGTLFAQWKGPAPSLLFLWVTDAQANLLQRELSAIQPPPTASGPSCCCLLLVLKEQLQDLQPALLASILDMEEYKRACSSSGGPTSPLEWTDGLLLLHSCPPPLDQHLLKLLGHSVKKSSQVRNNQRSKKIRLSSSGLQQLPTRLIQYPAAPSKGRITVSTEDLACLSSGEFLNDVIIDFYLKYLLLDGVGGLVAGRSHVFSSFFYKQLSRRRAAGEDSAPSVPDRHMRHQRVKTWTRHVDIFTKDFLFVPVNQEAHWYLVVVCFPGLEEVQYEEFQSPTEAVTMSASLSKGRCGEPEVNRCCCSVSGGSQRAAGKPSLSLRPQPLDCTQQSCQRDTVLKRPCILIMDSLMLSYYENVCRLLRDYLQVEWEVRRKTPRLFTPDSMRSSTCRVPQQDNSSDCGLYLLQYAESFLQNPVVHFDLPLRLENWFPRQRARQKRNEIRSLILTMHRSQSTEN